MKFSLKKRGKKEKEKKASLLQLSSTACKTQVSLMDQVQQVLVIERVRNIVRIQRVLANMCFEALKSAPEEEKICWKKNSNKIFFYVKNKKTGNVFFFKYCCIYSIWWNKIRQICYPPLLHKNTTNRLVKWWRAAVLGTVCMALSPPPQKKPPAHVLFLWGHQKFLADNIGIFWLIE